jgi:hypothetical protein
MGRRERLEVSRGYSFGSGDDHLFISFEALSILRRGLRGFEIGNRSHKQVEWEARFKRQFRS